MILSNTTSYFKFIGTLFISLLLLKNLSFMPANALSASIVLSPEEGVSTITIEGLGFDPNSIINVYWDDEHLPTVPLHVFTDENGTFTCIISAYDQTGVGVHEVKAVDANGNFALATFTVTDIKGSQGEQGPPGTAAEGISLGYLAGLFLLAAAIGGLIGIFSGKGYRSKREPDAEATSKGVEPLQ